MNRQFGNAVRTQAQKSQSALLWIHTARPHMLTLTADELCARHGITSKRERETIAKALLRRQLGESNA